MSIEINCSEVTINGVTIGISKKPKFITGVPGVTTHATLVGDEVKVTQAKDFTKAMGKVTVAMRHTLENLNLLSGWQENVGKNAIRMVDSETGFTKTFNQMSIEEDPEIDFDSEEFEVMFLGGAGS